MSRLPFRQLPLLVKVAVALTLFNSWVLFEEVVIDRQGLWKYLPFYRVGILCAWDVLGLIVIGIVIWLASHRTRSD
jgi:hypothetical protein